MFLHEQLMRLNHDAVQAEAACHARALRLAQALRAQRRAEQAACRARQAARAAHLAQQAL